MTRLIYNEQVCNDHAGMTPTILHLRCQCTSSLVVVTDLMVLLGPALPFAGAFTGAFFAGAFFCVPALPPLAVPFLGGSAPFLEKKATTVFYSKMMHVNE